MNNYDLNQNPALREKVIIDFVNNITNNKDLINNQKKQKGFFENIFSQITGKNKKEITLLFQNMNQQFESVLEYFEYFSKLYNISFNEIESLKEGFKFISDQLLKTREIVTESNQKIKNKINEISQEINKINDRLDKIDLKVDIQHQIETQFSKLELKYYDNYPILARIIIVVKNIFSQSLGYFITKYPNEKERIKDYKIQILAKIKTYLKGNFKSDIIYINELVKDVNELNQENKDILLYILNENKREVISYSLKQVVEKEDGYEFIQTANEERLKTMPYIFDLKTLAENIFDELNYSRG